MLWFVFYAKLQFFPNLHKYFLFRQEYRRDVQFFETGEQEEQESCAGGFETGEQEEQESCAGGFETGEQEEQEGCSGVLRQENRRTGVREEQEGDMLIGSRVLFCG